MFWNIHWPKRVFVTPFSKLVHKKWGFTPDVQVDWIWYEGGLQPRKNLETKAKKTGEKSSSTSKKLEYAKFLSTLEEEECRALTEEAKITSIVIYLHISVVSLGFKFGICWCCRRSLHDLAVGSAQRKPKEDVVCNDRRHELCFPHLRPQKDLIGSSKKIAQVFWWLVEAPTRPLEIGASKALLDLEDPTRGWSIAQSQDSNSGPTATALRKLSRRCRKTSFFIDPCDPFQHHCDFSILRDQPPAEYLSYVIVIMFTTSQSMPEFALREGQFWSFINISCLGMRYESQQVVNEIYEV